MAEHLTVKETIRRMAENDLIRNIDKGFEYTGFKALCCEKMMEEKHVSRCGHVYDISNYEDSAHLLAYFDEIIKEEEKPEVVMTSGTFFSMNKKMQKAVVRYLVILSKKGSVVLYVGDKKIPKLFKSSQVQVKVFDRTKYFIPHFIKTKERFEFVLPHTEKKLVRVDINSGTFDREKAERILAYFDKLVMDLDKAMENNYRMDTNAEAKHI